MLDARKEMPNQPYVHEARLRVRYAETDQMGVAYHSNHLVWMEIGRVEYCRSIGIRYRDLEESGGILLAVVEVRCRYRGPARYDDEVAVRTRLESLGSRGMQFAYELSLADTGKAVAEGYSKHVFCDRLLKPARLPDQYLRVFQDAFVTGQQHTQVG
jgi:acyl-CoA thioester hydrolase